MPSILDFGLNQALSWPKRLLDTQSHPLHTHRHSPDMLQTPCRHPSATLWKCWHGALGERTVDLYTGLFVVGMALRRVGFTKALTTHSKDTLQTLPDIARQPIDPRQKSWNEALGKISKQKVPLLFWLDWAPLSPLHWLNTHRHPIDSQTPSRHHVNNLQKS